MSKQEYVVGFLFDKYYKTEHVLLILKQKPLWQSGKYNGIGGKVEEGETPLEAMHREFKEEVGLEGLDWQPLCTITGSNEVVHFFDAYDDQRIWEKRKMEAETTMIFPVDYLFGVPLMQNLKFLIPLAMNRSGIQKPIFIGSTNG